ncbi:phosphotransferase [Kitasatospora cineracea]
MTELILHEGEIPADAATVRALLREQRPEWAGLPVVAAGAGTDNRMFRLGEGLLVRLPRTAEHAGALRKERSRLPGLAAWLAPLRVPEPVHAGVPGAAFPLDWSVYRWIEGAPPGPGTVSDWAALGTALAGAVRALHAAPLPTAGERAGLDGYRGRELGRCDGWVGQRFAELGAAGGDGLDLPLLAGLWRAGAELPAPAGPPVWLHGDLKPSNLLVRDGALHAVIDFGGLAVGFPDAEHAPVWDLPAAARRAYWRAAALPRETWLRARAWAVAVAAAGLPYYRERDPAFAAECLARLTTLQRHPAEGDPGGC